MIIEVKQVTKNAKIKDLVKKVEFTEDGISLELYNFIFYEGDFISVFDIIPSILNLQIPRSKK